MKVPMLLADFQKQKNHMKTVVQVGHQRETKKVIIIN